MGIGVRAEDEIEEKSDAYLDRGISEDVNYFMKYQVCAYYSMS